MSSETHNPSASPSEACTPLTWRPVVCSCPHIWLYFAQLRHRKVHQNHGKLRGGEVTQSPAKKGRNTMGLKSENSMVSPLCRWGSGEQVKVNWGMCLAAPVPEHAHLQVPGKLLGRQGFSAGFRSNKAREQQSPHRTSAQGSTTGWLAFQEWKPQTPSVRSQRSRCSLCSQRGEANAQVTWCEVAGHPAFI